MKKGSVGFKPENLTQPNILSTWKAMEALNDSGKARAIGVSNFSSKKLGDLLEVARVPPAVNQVESHPSWQQPGLHAFCKSKGVHLSVSMRTYKVVYNFYVPKSERSRIYASKSCRID
jgi:alcohol dehydrogenase (NADP+)